jgi:hypothetical protein
MPNDLRWQSAQNAVMGLSNNLLMPLVLGKIKHNMEMEQTEVALKAADVAAKAKAQEERAQIGLRAAAKGKEDRATLTHKSTLGGGLDPKYKVGELKSFDVGEQKWQGIYTGKETDIMKTPNGSIVGWKDTGVRAPRYKPGTTVNVNNKLMPATEVAKIGEFQAYIDTMGEINQLIDAGEGNVTGPFEFINKRIDNWGIMPNEERIKMRSLVARMPGLMYAMRGKQLSDKELQVALDMMPQMSMDETAFGIQLQKFNEYMMTVLSGKEEAFKGAGYQTGGFTTKKKSTQNKRPSLDSFEQ